MPRFYGVATNVLFPAGWGTHVVLNATFVPLTDAGFAGQCGFLPALGVARHTPARALSGTDTAIFSCRFSRHGIIADVIKVRWDFERWLVVIIKSLKKGGVCKPFYTI